MGRQLKKQRKTATADIYADRYIHANITVSEFFELVKHNPYSIMNNFEVRYAIEVLQHEAVNGSPRTSKIARELLREIGLKAFIPKGAGHPKSPNAAMRYLKKYRFKLYDEIDKTEKSVRLIWHKHPSDQVGNAVREIVGELYKFSPKESDIKEIVKGERSAHATNLALSIEAWAFGISYSSLHKFYYNSETVAERRKYFEQKDDKRKRSVEASELKIKRLPRQPTNIFHDHESAISIYDYAYGAYKIRHSFLFPFLCNDEDFIKFKTGSRVTPDS